MHRESIYSGLLKTVSEYEEKIDALRFDNEHWREKLHELQIQQSEGQSTQTSKEGKSFAPELSTLENKLTQERKVADSAKQIAKKVQLVDD